MVIGGRSRHVIGYLQDFLFTPDRARSPVSLLSGGELRRLELLKLLIGGPNLLVLDEPTNDLDVETLAVIEDVLDSWPGTLVVVSHDRYFLERTCDDLYALLGDGRLRHLPRGVEEYLELRSAASGRLRSTGSKAPGAAGVAVPVGSSGSGARREVGGRSAGTRASAGSAPAGLTGAAAHAARKDLARAETRMARIEALRAELHAQMADSHTDHERLLALATEDSTLAAEQVELEERWLELGEALEG
jgi:ABC-type multidrug transport system ATPase subunit